MLEKKKNWTLKANRKDTPRRTLKPNGKMRLISRTLFFHISLSLSLFLSFSLSLYISLSNLLYVSSLSISSLSLHPSINFKYYIYFLYSFSIIIKLTSLLTLSVFSFGFSVLSVHFNSRLKKTSFLGVKFCYLIQNTKKSTEASKQHVLHSSYSTSWNDYQKKFEEKKSKLINFTISVTKPNIWKVK